MDGTLGRLHGQPKLAVLGKDLSQELGIEGRGTVRVVNNVVAFRHRWWLLCKDF